MKSRYFTFLHHMSSFFKGIGRHVAEIVFSILAIVLICCVLVPNISLVSSNSAASKCRDTMDLIAFFLESEINDENIEYDWSSVLYQKRSQKLFDVIKEYADNEELKQTDTSDFYFQATDTSLLLMCRYHEQNDPIEIQIPEKYRRENVQTQKPVSQAASTLTVTGSRTYIKGEQLDKSQPEKMIFSSEDDLKSLFDDITVSVKLLDGSTKILDKDSYTLSTEGFDMSKTGRKTIKVTCTADVDWNTALTGLFSFDVMENSQAPEFIVNFGKKGKYFLAAWDWSDYVKDAAAGIEDKMNFDASIIYYNGSYLYYPDGFTISKLKENTNPLNSALDKDDNSYNAYCIKFDTSRIINNPDDMNEMKKVHDGALMMDENNDIYIWQCEPSKEVDAGWLRVYCEIQKR